VPEKNPKRKINDMRRMFEGEDLEICNKPTIAMEGVPAQLIYFNLTRFYKD